MLDIKFIRENPKAVQQNATNRGIKVDINLVLELDEQLRSHKKITEELREQRNLNADKLKNMENKTSAEAKGVIAEGKELKIKIAEVEAELGKYKIEFSEKMSEIPNLTHPASPLGKDDNDNVEINRIGKPTEFTFKPKDLLQLSEKLDIYDFERGADVAGAGFYFTKNEAALLELALVNYAVDICTAEGFELMITPDLAKQEVLQGTGYNPRGEETQIYNIENTDLSLIATSEITVAGYFRNQTFEQGELDQPKKIVAISHCYRTEAGSYGRESRGLYRVHQFTKVEMFIFCKPADSAAMHDYLLEVEEKIMDGLEIPYRVVDICTGDLGGPAYRKYDIEAWMPFKDGWGEATSASNCTDYQARRLAIKYKDENNQRQLVHTLNGTAVATTRHLIALIENNQHEDGSVKIPAILHPYMLGVTDILPKK